MTTCARSAPGLPPELGREQGAATLPTACADIDRSLAQLGVRMDGLEAPIQANRSSNQAYGYFGALLLVPLVGLDANSAEKESLDAAQQERDRLLAQRAAGACPPPATDATGRVRITTP